MLICKYRTAYSFMLANQCDSHANLVTSICIHIYVMYACMFTICIRYVIYAQERFRDFYLYNIFTLRSSGASRREEKLKESDCTVSVGVASNVIGWGCGKNKRDKRIKFDFLWKMDLELQTRYIEF